jgi:NADPH:quinone reductase-like Zn-dependent oxidoreductase
MKAYQFQEQIGIDNLHRVEIPAPKPGPGQVLVRVHAVSLNFKDLFVARGIPPRDARTTLIPISDGAGEVLEIGDGVTRFKKGDRVAAIVAQKWIEGPLTHGIAQSVLGTAIDGMLAEYVTLDEEGIVPIPAHLTFEEAATLPCAGATAWNALTFEGGVRAGDTVLVQGSGGVSVFALQFAKLLGARVIATSSSDDKLQRLRELGAFAGINYKLAPEWDEEAKRLTGGAGVDRVVEVGGAGTLEKSFNATAQGGTISLVGVLAGLEGTVNPLPVLFKGLRLLGTSVGPRRIFEEMNRAIEQHGLRPVIGKVFPFEQAREALHFLQSGGHFGKIVVQF